jgi:spermidine synthase
VVYLLFFFSGASALIYEVVWVRVFANVFGNTIYSASIITAVFMLGLGLGGYVVGIWADRRYARRNLLRVFAVFELAVGAAALAISFLLPHLGEFSAAVSSYTRGDHGWYVLSAGSYAARAAIAIVLLTPVTMLMGGTLTVLIRHLTRADEADRREANRGSSGADLFGPRIGIGPRIGLLYGVNTLGAAAGCFLTDFALVPSYGLRATQLIAVAINLATATGALVLKSRIPNPKLQIPASPQIAPIPKNPRIPDPRSPIPVWPAAATLAATGFAAMGMEILWFRQFSILLGEFRAVFALLLAVILLAMGAGSLAGGYIQRRTTQHPAHVLAIVQGLVVASTLAGLASANARAISDAAASYAALHPGLMASGVNRELAELWFNVRPILLIAAVPALLMGFVFPLANAIVQDAEAVVGRRAGLLYLANTFGAVCGALATGFLLLPVLGMQQTATALMLAALASVVPMVRLKANPTDDSGRIPVGDRIRRKAPVGSGFSRTFGPHAVSLVVGVGSIATWLSLPANYLLSRALLFPPGRTYTISEGITELIAVTDGPDGGRVLVTNGHPMSSTELLSQRYMRAMAHVPLLTLDNPQRVLVICYGVGNTAHAVTLHPTVQRVDVVDLSRHVLEHSTYFKEVNGDVLNDPRVTVYVNDGRHHLQMNVEAGLQTRLYDLITLEPPPIVHAGVAALYTTEFYARARSRLNPGGYISQWLPAFGVPQSMILSMVRSFVDVFPNAVLLSGASSNLLLIGTTGAANQIDPTRLANALRRAPAVQADLQRLDLGTTRDVVGMFVASATTLATATRDVQPVSDDRPIQEYGKKSLLNFDEGVPPSIVNVSEVAAWCPSCFIGGRPAPVVDGLDTYLSVLDLAYRAPRVAPAQTVATGPVTPIAGSGYLGSVVPQSPELNAVLRGAFLDKYQKGTDLLVARQYPDAINALRSALLWNDRSAEAHNNLGIALASTGRMQEAIDQFRLALASDPEFDDAKRNLAMATRRQ